MAGNSAGQAAGGAGPMVHFRKRMCLLLAIVALPAVYGLGCGGTRMLDASFAGRTLVYTPGVPDFDLEADTSVRDSVAGILIAYSIPHASLVFRPVEGHHRARYGTLIRLYDERGRTLLYEESALDTVRLATYDEALSFTPHVGRTWLPVGPGRYVVEVTLRDEESAQEATRRRRVDVVALGSRTPLMTAIRLEGRRANRPPEPQLSVNLPVELDSLRATVELLNVSHLGDVDVEMALVRFPSDTSTAAPPYGFTSPSFGYQVRYDRADTLQVSRRSLHDSEPQLTVEFDLPALMPGVHRIEITVVPSGTDPSEPGAALRETRDFVVRSPAFPRIATLPELVDALVYIARRQEVDSIRAADTPEAMKRRFDAFWGSLIANRNLAGNLLRLYYSRVEEANLRFSTYKEGWKTDRGMVYIIFGPPLYIDDSIERVVWRYSYDEREVDRMFVFYRRRIYQSQGLFDVYLLQREAYYETEWRRAVERWREGTVL